MDVDDARQRLQRILSCDENLYRSARKTFDQFLVARPERNDGRLKFPEIRSLIDSLTKSLNIRNASDETLQQLVRRYGGSDDTLDFKQFGALYRDLLTNIRQRWFDKKPSVPRESFVPQRSLRHGYNIHGQKSCALLADFLEFGQDLGAGTFGQAHLDEVEILKRLDHPNIIKIYGVYEDQRGELYGHYDKINKDDSRLTERYVATIMAQILSAVAYGHEKRIAHKDLKLNNVLFWDARQRDIKVIDYGVAELFDRIDGCSKKFAGTPNFMAPEVVRCKLGLKCDVWSCGCILYALLTAKYPFGAPTVAAVVDRILHVEPNYEEDCQYVSPEAITLMKRMLTKSPEDRPSAAELQTSERPKLQTNTSKDVNSNIRASDEGALYRPLQISSEASTNLRSFMRHSNLKKILVNLMAHNLDVRGPQIRRIINDFKRLDTDGNGVLSYDELKTVAFLSDLRSRRYATLCMADENWLVQTIFWSSLAGLEKSGWRAADIARVLEALDLDHSRTIDYTEFLAACYTWRAREYNAVWWAFNSLDTDCDGKITVEEFATLFRRGESGSQLIDDGDLQRLMARIDKDGNGYIEWDEFYAYVREGQ